MRTVTETIYVTKYEAYDGTRFDKEDDCIEYENNIKTILNNWKKIPKLECSNESLVLSSGAGDAHFILWCRDQDDIDAANAYIKECDVYEENFLTSADIRRRVVICVWNYYDYNHEFGKGVTRYGYPEEILESYKEMMFAPIPKEVEVNE